MELLCFQPPHSRSSPLPSTILWGYIGWKYSFSSIPKDKILHKILHSCQHEHFQTPPFFTKTPTTLSSHTGLLGLTVNKNFIWNQHIWRNNHKSQSHLEPTHLYICICNILPPLFFFKSLSYILPLSHP